MNKLFRCRNAQPIAWLLCAVVILSVLTACASPTPPPAPVTLRFAFPAADANHFTALADQFTRANPGIKIELVSRRWDPLTGIVDPSGADVLLTSQFGLDDLRNKGTLVSLDALIAGDRNLNAADFLPNAPKMFITNGKTWALPAGLDPQVVYFSKDFFDQRKVAYPEAGWNWDSFRNTILKLRDPAAGIYGYAVITDYLDPILFVYQHGGRLFDNLQDPTRTTFTDPKTIEAVEWYARLVQEPGAVLTPQIAQKAGVGNSQNAIRANRVGMWIGPLSSRGGRTERAAWPIRWGMVPLPRDAQAATMATAAGYAITTQCQKSLACWQWIAFASQHTVTSFAPARASLVKSAAGQDADVAKIAQASLDSALLIRAGDLSKLEKAIGAFTQAVNAVIEGRASAAEALALAQQASALP